VEVKLLFRKNYIVTAVAPPPIVKNAEISNKIPIDRYRSKSMASFMNKAPLNKSACQRNKDF
jgi:hypothetical protein